MSGHYIKKPYITKKRARHLVDTLRAEGHFVNLNKMTVRSLFEPKNIVEAVGLTANDMDFVSKEITKMASHLNLISGATGKKNAFLRREFTRQMNGMIGVYCYLKGVDHTP